MLQRPDLLNHTFALKDAGVSNALQTVSAVRHRWYYVKEAFSPALVTEALRRCRCVARSVVLDPFCGSGTVPLVASSAGHRSIGIEVNPFLAFVASTKLVQCSPVRVETAGNQAKESMRELHDSPLKGFSTFTRTAGAAKWLFSDEVLAAFHGGWCATEAIEPPARSLVRLAMIGAAMDQCNATRDGKALRYRKDWKLAKRTARDFVVSFDSRLAAICEDLMKPPPVGGVSEIRCGDSRQLVSCIEEPFDLCLTSPPYLNSFDYTDLYRPELFLGGFVQGQEELRQLRQQTIRSHVQAKWEDPTASDFGPEYQRAMEQLESRKHLLWNKRIPLMVQAYFEDMRGILTGLRGVARPGASVWLVVSTSAYADTVIPVDEVIAHVAKQAGWEPVEIGLLRYLRTSSHHAKRNKAGASLLRESVVILRA